MYQLLYNMEKGYIYAPYILKESTQDISDNNYVCKKMIKNRYNVVNIDNFLEKRRLKIEKIINKLHHE